MKKRRILIIVLGIAGIIIVGVFLGKAFLAENKVPDKFPAQPPEKVEQKLQKAALNT